jgi:hypothetical protein
LNQYCCTVFCHDTYEDHEGWLGPEYVPAVRIASVRVYARNGREAAARAYVRTVGGVRARKLRELNAPAFIIQAETSWRRLTRRLGRTSNWLGRCFVYDNMVEAFYVRVQRRSGTRSLTARRLARRRRLLRASRSPSPN